MPATDDGRGDVVRHGRRARGHRSGRRLPAGRRDLPVRGGRRLVVGSRRHLRPPRADLRGALRRLVPGRARRAALQASAQRRRPAPGVLSGRRARAARRGGTGRAARNRSVRCGSRSTRGPSRRGCWPASQRMHVEGEAGAGRPGGAGLQRSDAARAAARPRQLPSADHDRGARRARTRRSWICSGTTARSSRRCCACSRRPRCRRAATTRSPPGTRACSRRCWSYRTGRPLMVTEHGIYARERDMELARADWIRDEAGGVSEPRQHLGAAHLAAAAAVVVVLPGAVAHGLRPGAQHHHALGRQPRQADRRRRAAREDRDRAQRRGAQSSSPAAAPPEPPAAAGQAPEAGDGVVASPPQRLRVGFVGRVVPIKDLVTFIRACDIALQRRRSRRARDRPDGRGSRLRGALPPAGGAARRGDEIRLRRTHAARPRSTAIWTSWS